MRTSYWLPALALGLGVLLAAPAADAPRANAERIAQLIKELNSDDFDTREKATEALEKIGTPALDALKKATKDGEAEVRTRAEGLVKKLETRAAAEKLLAPTKVKLLFKDTPLADAIAEFNKKSGYKIEIHDPDKKLKERTITLDTGEVTFWEAFDKFCAKAGLSEATMQDLMPRAFNPSGVVPPRPSSAPNRAVPAPPPPPDKKGGAAAAPAAPAPARAVARAQVLIQVGSGAAPPVAPPIRGGFGVVGGAPMRPFPGIGAMPGVIPVIDGKPKKLPTCYSGAVRIRVLRNGPNVGFGVPIPPPGAGPANDISVIWLEVRAEPKLQVLALQSVHLDKATDDQDQKLTEAAPAGPVPVPGFAPPGGAVPPVARPALRRRIRPMMGMAGLGTYPIAVRLKKGEKEAKALKEFAGSISAQVLAPAEAVVTADKITKAAGETFKGKNGGHIKVNEVREEDGKLTLKFQVEQPQDVMAPPGGGGPIGGIAFPRGIPVPPIRLVPLPPLPAPKPAAPGGSGVAFQAPPAPAGAPVPGVKIQIQYGATPPVGVRPFFPAPGITLVDDKGKTIPQSGGAPPRYEFNPGAPPKVEYTQEYKLGKDQKPAKLILSGSKMANLDIPFSFKDVPLK